MEEVNLDEWQWLREVEGSDIDTLNYYEGLSDKNEAVIIALPNRYSYNIYVPTKKEQTNDSK